VGFTIHEMAWSHWTRPLKLPNHIIWFHDLFILHKILWVKFWLEFGMNVWVWAWDLALLNRVVFIYLPNSFCNQITWSFYEVPIHYVFSTPLPNLELNSLYGHWLMTTSFCSKLVIKGQSHYARSLLVLLLPMAFQCTHSYSISLLFEGTIKTLFNTLTRHPEVMWGNNHKDTT
jgi:hypothetical protein